MNVCPKTTSFHLSPPPHTHSVTHTLTVHALILLYSESARPTSPRIVVAYFGPTHACLTLYSAPDYYPTQSRAAADAVTTATGGRLSSKDPLFPYSPKPTTSMVGADNIAANPQLRPGARGVGHRRALGPLHDRW